MFLAMNMENRIWIGWLSQTACDTQNLVWIFNGVGHAPTLPQCLLVNGRPLSTEYSFWLNGLCEFYVALVRYGSGTSKPRTGARFNIKMTSYRYRKSYCGDKTVVRSSYLHNGISYTGKMSSLYWIRAQYIRRVYHYQIMVHKWHL